MPTSNQSRTLAKELLKLFIFSLIRLIEIRDVFYGFLCWWMKMCSIKGQKELWILTFSQLITVLTYRRPPLACVSSPSWLAIRLSRKREADKKQWERVKRWRFFDEKENNVLIRPQTHWSPASAERISAVIASPSLLSLSLLLALRGSDEKPACKFPWHLVCPLSSLSPSCAFCLVFSHLGTSWGQKSRRINGRRARESPKAFRSWQAGPCRFDAAKEKAFFWRRAKSAQDNQSFAFGFYRDEP